MDINTNFYEFIPEITGDNEIQRELRNIIKDATGMFENYDYPTQDLIDEIQALISSSRESAFNTYSRQRRTKRKGSIAQNAIDELGIRILDVLRESQATQEVALNILRERKLTHITHSLYQDLFVGVTKSPEKILQYICILQELQNNPCLLDQLCFNPVNSGPVDFCGDLIKYIDKSGLLFDLFGETRFTGYTSPQDFANEFNRIIGIDLFSGVDVLVYKDCIEDDGTLTQFDIKDLQSFINQYKLAPDDMVVEIRRLLMSQQSRPIDSFTEIVEGFGLKIPTLQKQTKKEL